MTNGLHLSPRHREEIEALQDSTIPFLVEVRDWARLPESFHREIEHEHVVLVEREERDEAGEWQRRENPAGRQDHYLDLRSGIELHHLAACKGRRSYHR